MLKLKKYKCAICGFSIFYALLEKGIVSRDCTKCKCRNVLTVDVDNGIDKLEITEGVNVKSPTRYYQNVANIKTKVTV